MAVSQVKEQRPQTTIGIQAPRPQTTGFGSLHTVKISPDFGLEQSLEDSAHLVEARKKVEGRDAIAKEVKKVERVAKAGIHVPEGAIRVTSKTFMQFMYAVDHLMSGYATRRVFLKAPANERYDEQWLIYEDSSVFKQLVKQFEPAAQRVEDLNLH